MSELPFADTMEWISMYLPIILGTPFMLYSGYRFAQTQNLYHAAVMMCAFWMVFNQADRNVYYKRIRNLATALGEVEGVSFNVERVRYTDYEVTVNDDE